MIMSRNTILSILTVLIISCTNKVKEKTNDYIPIVDHYDNGALKSKGFVYPASGDRVGNWEYYFQNGSVRAKGVYENGYKVSLWEYFAPYEKVYWTVYFDSTLNVEFNVPSNYKVFSQYQGKNILAAFDS